MSSSARRTRTTRTCSSGTIPNTQSSQSPSIAAATASATPGGLRDAPVEVGVDRAHGLDQRGILSERCKYRGGTAPQFLSPALGVRKAVVQERARHAPGPFRCAFVRFGVTGSPAFGCADDQRFDEPVLRREVMQQAAFAHARLGGDGVERQARNTLASNHSFGGVEKRIL